MNVLKVKEIFSQELFRRINLEFFSKDWNFCFDENKEVYKFSILYKGSPPIGISTWKSFKI